MRTTFSGISIALRALQAQQVSLDITGHNVANANNPNYSRQVALHAATKPFPMPMMGYTPSKGQLGTGVEVSQIVRMRDNFVDPACGSSSRAATSGRPWRKGSGR